MKRSILLNLLQKYSPLDQQEQIFKKKMLAFIQKYENCFERSLAIGHITASAWLINIQGTHALLMHHAKLNQWFQLGGHCDGNPDVLAAALTEAQEESGIGNIVLISTDIFDIDIHLIPENSREKAHYHYDVRFLLQVTTTNNVIQNAESKELRWIGKQPDQLPTNNPAVTRMFYKWINQ